MEVPIFIEKEENPEKRKMLHSVLMNNTGYVKNKTQELQFNKILKAMSLINRKMFVMEDDLDNAYMDIPLDIGYEQTISQPTTVARMLLLADLKKDQEILEVGAGSGWNSSLAAFIVGSGKVTAVERIKPLFDLARRNSGKFNSKVEFVFGNALNPKNVIWKKSYDRIIVTAAASAELEHDLKKVAKLKEEGMILFPTQRGSLELWRKKKGRLLIDHIEEGYTFVPLVK